jgi:hypothetical protein
LRIKRPRKTVPSPRDLLRFFSLFLALKCWANECRRFAAGKITGGLSSSKTHCLVPSKGLEPPHRCRYMDLNHARLPIPPRWQVDSQCRSQNAAASGRPAFLFYRDAVRCQTTSASHPLRIFFRLDDLSVAHVNDAITVFRRFWVMRDHQNGLTKFLI